MRQNYLIKSALTLSALLLVTTKPFLALEARARANHQEQVQKEDAEQLFHSAIENYNNRHYQSAIDELDKAIEIEPAFSQAYHNRGSAKQELNQHESAIQDFDKAILLEADSSILYHYFNNRAWSKYRLNRLEEALVDANRSILLNDKYPNSFHTRASIKHAMGDSNGACLDMRQTIAIGGSKTIEWFNEDGRFSCP